MFFHRYYVDNITTLYCKLSINYLAYPGTNFSMVTIYNLPNEVLGLIVSDCINESTSSYLPFLNISKLFYRFVHPAGANLSAE